MSRETPQVSEKVCCVAYEDRGKATGRRDLRLADGLSDLGRVCCRGAEHLAPGNEPIRLLLTFIEPRGVGDLEAGNPPRDMQETAISMVETSVANQV